MKRHVVDIVWIFRRGAAWWFMLALTLATIQPVAGQDSRGDHAVPDLSLYPALFKRAQAPGPEATSILSVGDTSFARGVAEYAATRQMDDLLAPTAPLIATADLAIGNYEGVIAAEDVGEKQPGPFRLKSDPAAAGALARAGFDLFTLANNHTMDFGPAGMDATLKHLNDAGVKTFGIGKGKTAAYAPLVTEVNGLKIVWVGFTLVPDPYITYYDWDEQGYRAWLIYGQFDKLIEVLDAARPLGDVMIVQFHWGDEYTFCPNEWQVKYARMAVDHGADLVIGHHPHVVQDVEVYNGAFIAYSLGNFLFDQDNKAGLAIWATLDKYGVIEVRGISLRSGVLPEWHDPATAAQTVRNVCRPEASRLDPGGDVAVSYANGVYGISPTKRALRRCNDPAAERLIGKMDMEGDGDPESVYLQGGTLTVRSPAGRTVYTSHPTWRVVDAALGDPNWDGRREVLMLLWKQNAPGAPVTTHPFILGYRGGQYDVIWGGSETLHSLNAVALADLDGDLDAELVTIERESGATFCEANARIVVLAWNGWGFTRRWRSEPGPYATLQATPEAVIARSC